MADRVTPQQAKRIRELQNKLGDRTLRQLLSQNSNRLVDKRRLSNLTGGSGRLSASDQERLDLISRNATQISALKKRGKGKREHQTNRALQTWVTKGKTKSQRATEQSDSDRGSVIRSLGFLGVDPADGTFYVRRAT